MLMRLVTALLRSVAFRALAPYDDPYGGSSYGRSRARQSRTTISRPRSQYGSSYGGDSSPRRPSSSKRPTGKLVVLIGLVVAMVLVIAGTLGVEAQLASHARTNTLPGSGVGNGTPPVAPTGNGTATTSTLPPPTPGWTQVGPRWAQRGAIAESAQARMYVCGFATANAQTGPISLGASANGGATWQTLATPAAGAYCDVRVSTTTPQDVALYAAAVCDPSGCTSSDPNQLYVSADGGAHWSKPALPATNGTPATPVGTFAWAGNTLFVLTSGQSQAAGHYLAASTSGQAFTWVDQNITGLPSGTSPIAGEFRAIGATLYVTFSSNNCSNAQSNCLYLARTGDGGATWMTTTASYGGHAYAGIGAIRLVAGAPSAPLIARAEQCSCSAGPTLRSTDGGTTWTDLPAYPQGYMSLPFSTVETPDGTVYAALGTSQLGSGPSGIYVVRPGAASWQLVAYPTGDQWWEFMMVSWDASGHPAGLWGWSYSTDTVEGVWRHAA